MQKIPIQNKEHLERIALLIADKRQRPIEEVKTWLDSVGGFLSFNTLQSLCELVGWDNVFVDRNNIKEIANTDTINDCFGLSKIGVKVLNMNEINRIKLLLPLDKKSLLLKTPVHRIKARAKVKMEYDNVLVVSYFFDSL